jgi:hypothetical protein
LISTFLFRYYSEYKTIIRKHLWSSPSAPLYTYIFALLIKTQCIYHWWILNNDSNRHLRFIDNIKKYCSRSHHQLVGALIGLPIKVIIIVRSKHQKHNLTDIYNLIFLYILILLISYRWFQILCPPTGRQLPPLKSFCSFRVSSGCLLRTNIGFVYWNNKWDLPTAGSFIIEVSLVLMEINVREYRSE